MAKSSNRSCAEWLGIDDFEAAFAFNMECSETLAQFEMEMEAERAKRQTEVLTGQAVSSALGGSPPSGNVERW